MKRRLLVFIAPVALLVSCGTDTSDPAPDVSPELYFVAGMAAHHLCSGTFVVGRDYQRSPEQVIAQDIVRFPIFRWQDDFEYDVDLEAGTATVRVPGIEPRTAKYNGDQGCAILPRGESNVYYEPVEVPRHIPDPETTPWPTGNVGATGAPPPEVDEMALEEALDWAMEQPLNTRALVVIYKGKILGERYAPGFTKNTPQISWSQGKSITAALIGILVEQGHLRVEEPAPVKEWRGEDDPRNAIRIEHLLRMSSGLDFKYYRFGTEKAWTEENDHLRIYIDTLNIFEHAVNRPLEIPPGSEIRYRNSDPLTLGRIVRETVEANGEEYLTFPQRSLFDRIGARNFVLETDPYGNFIMTGYDYGSAWDWARFGLLHLWDGVWDGERILPEGWVELISTPASWDPNQSYGGLFWLNRGGSYARIPRDAFWSSGFMGQTTMVIPSRDIVIVRLGPSPDAEAFGKYFNEVVGRTLDAIACPIEPCS